VGINLNVSLRKKSFYIDYTNKSSSTDFMKNFHLHDDYEIFYLIEGERIYYINEEEYVVQKNSLVFIDKNIIHKTEVTDVDEYQRIVINFRDTLLSNEDQFFLLKLFESGPHVISIPLDKRKIISTLIHKLYQEYIDEKQHSINYIRLLLTQLLIESNRLLQQQQLPEAIESGNNAKQDEIARIIKYINTYYYDNISLSLLSQHFHLSEQYISRLFRKVTGGTIINYLNAVRVNEAKRLLLETDMKVIEISKTVGYSNNVHLWRVFKNLTGLSPAEYRENNK